MKTKKRKKESRMHGRKMGTHGGGARKKRKGSGHRGGSGLSGSGKRADHKKTLINKLYGNKYFGKQGITSKRTERDKRKKITLENIESNIGKYKKESKAGNIEINLKNYKILLGPKGYEVKNKMIITAESASKNAIEMVKKKGGEIVFKEKAKPEKHESA